MNHFREIPMCLFIFLSIAAISTNAKIDEPAEMSSEEAAARCVGMVNKCTENLAKKSGICETNKFFYEQSETCRITACIFCRNNWAAKYNFCIRSWTMLFRCPLTVSWPTTIPTMSTSTSPSVHLKSASKTSSTSISASTSTTPLLISPYISSRSELLSISVVPSPSASYAPSASVSVSSSSSPSISETPSTSLVDSSSSPSSPSVSFSTSPSNSSPKSKPISTPGRIPDPRAASECVSKQQLCTKSMADKSGVCLENIYVANQPELCRKTACQYCASAFGRLENICKESWAIRSWCPGITFSSVTPTPLMSSTPKSGNVTANALCISKAKKCTKEEADDSLGCKPGLYVAKQSIECVEGACKFCRHLDNKDTGLCSKNWAIQIYCYNSPRPSVTPSRTPSQTPSTSVSSSSTPSISMSSVVKSAVDCKWIANGETLAIPMKGVKPFDNWSLYEDAKDNDNEIDGIVWRKNENHGWTDKPGSGGLCFKTKFKRAGNYYTTAYTKGDHWSEHNDFWLNFTGGFNIYRAGTHEKLNVPPFKSFKAYQNLGDNKLANIISTVNHKPHIFVTKKVETNKEYNVCIAGRSSKFKILKLVFVLCDGLNCSRTSSHIRNTMKAILAEDRISFSQC